jgi:cytochrome c1
VIPGVVGANRSVGPPLAGIANRQYIAGVLPNTPANMMRWLRQPTKVDPLSAMPDLDVTEQDARDIAAFLYTLRQTD